MPDKQARILERRVDEHLRNMQRVVDAMKARAEASTGDDAT
jgi:hypothetical protein